MGQLEKFKMLSAEVLGSGSTSLPSGGLSLATAGLEYPVGKVQIQNL